MDARHGLIETKKSDITNTLRIGDSRKLIKDIPDKSIDCVMTSPPYWGLRDYGHPDQIGLEATPEEYLKTLLDFFDDVKLKLKDEGNCFVNLGDTYAGSNGAGYKQTVSKENQSLSGAEGNRSLRRESNRQDNLPAKSLCMIPQRFAWGMIERGWILRNEIVWAKPNHMPESVTDRLTKAHEVIYHFVKQGKYYYNLDAIREKHKLSTFKRNEYGYGSNNKHNGIASMKGFVGKTDGIEYNPLGKNPGDVWNITTQPYPESHFAVFPLELVRKPILAGCPPQGTVLDPFGGSGTVGEFCRHNDRNAILFELNPAYKPLIEDRAMLNISELSEWG